MNTLHRQLVCASAALVLASAGLVLSQEPTARPVGHVLVLDNERVLEGAITREGDRYVIRRSVGEMKIPVAKALAVCAISGTTRPGEPSTIVGRKSQDLMTFLASL